MIYKYCPDCKGELKKEGNNFCCQECKLIIYQNSKPCAGVLIIDGMGKVLLGKRGVEPYKGCFDVIGGFLELGELPEAGAIREVKEETSLDVEIIDFLGMYVDRYGEGGDFTLNIYYIGKIIGGEMKAQSDVSSLEWIDIKELPVADGFKNCMEATRGLKKYYNKK